MTGKTFVTPAEHWSIDEATGVGEITFRAPTPPKDTPLDQLDGHFLGARLAAPLKKPWLDTYDNVQQHASPGSVHAVVAEALAPWSSVAASQTANTQKSLARPINFMGTQVCVGGGLPPCGKSVPVFQWESQHDYRPLRHLLAWLRWGWDSDGFLVRCAVSRILHEPTLYDEPHNQREFWDLRVLAEAFPHLPDVQADMAVAITKMVDGLWKTKGPNYLCTLTPEQQKTSNHLAVVSWQHAVPTVALDVLVRMGWPDVRVAQLYKIAIKGLDAMRKPGAFTWWKDWDPATGAHLDPESPFNGTSLWTACAYARSLDLMVAGADGRRAFLKGFMAQSAALHPDNSNFDPAAAALLTALVNQGG